MENRKVQSKGRYLLAFLIGTFFFLLIFEVTYVISYFELQRLSSLQNELVYEIFEDKLTYSLFSEQICSDEEFDKISQDLNFQGRLIEDLEKRLGKNNKQVLLKKKFYTLIELEHFEFVKQMNQDCDLGIQPILFFYSNRQSDLDESERVGSLLSVAYTKKENVIIYSFDVNLESNLISRLKEHYGIEEAPTLIIKEDVRVVNPTNLDEIVKYLN